MYILYKCVSVMIKSLKSYKDGKKSGNERIQLYRE